MQHMNIAFYSDTYLPAVDGVVTSMLDFKRELEKRGHKVYIFASAKIRDVRKYEADDVFLYTGVKFRPYPQYSVALFPYYSSFKLMGLDIDIIHAQTPFVMGFNGLLAAKFGRYPLAGTFHTLVNSRSLEMYYPKNRTLKKFYSKYVWKYTKLFYRTCDVTIVPSETISRMLGGHKINNVTVVPNGINPKLFNKRASGERLRKELGIRDREKVVLYVGRLSKEKKFDVLLRAMKVLLKKDRNMSLVVAGSGPASEDYKQLAIKLGIAHKTRFLGMMAHDSLPEVYAAGDVLCLPSTFETQGIVSLEAMATGTPVVAAAAMALNEMVQNGKNGEKFRPGDFLGCARNIEKVLNNYEPYRKHALKSAVNYSVERVTDRLVDTYDLLLSNGRFTG